MNKVWQIAPLSWAILLGIAACFIWLTARPQLPSQPVSTNQIKVSSSAAPSAKKLTRPEVNWQAPTAQSGGSEWIYEVFTPPIIWFNPHTQRFTVTPPLPPAEMPPFGLRLLAIERPLYRIQFGGYVGQPGNYLIEIQHVPSQTWLRGRVGDRFADHQFRIEDFTVSRDLVQPDDPDLTPYIVETIRLVIFDERLNQRIELSKEPRYTPQLFAQVEATTGETARLEVNQNMAGQDAIYTLRAIDPEAREITVVKQNLEGTQIETAVLRPEPRQPTPRPQAPAVPTPPRSAPAASSPFQHF